MANYGVAALLAVNWLADAALAAETGRKPADMAPRSPQRRITISEQTTRITRPLRADGYVDYIAALNAHFSKGVTPGNNSAVLMIQAMGPAVIPKEIRDKYVQLLGIPPLANDGPYFVDFIAHVQRAPAADGGKQPSDEDDSGEDDEHEQDPWDDLTRGMSRPWSKDELPTVAAWLEANERPLDLIVQATRRPRLYDPMIATGDSLSVIAMQLPMRN